MTVAKVNLGFEVEVFEEHVEGDISEMSEDELADEAKELIFDAPAFDGWSDEQISNLDVLSVEIEDDD
jgi:hypothetical protein